MSTISKGTLKVIKTIIKRAGFGGDVTEDNAQECIIALAESQPEFLADKLEKGYAHAVKLYGFFESEETRHFEENYKLISDNLDGVFALLDIETDYPGLYPTFTLKRNGKVLSEYSALGAIRQYNNFWGHW